MLSIVYNFIVQYSLSVVEYSLIYWFIQVIANRLVDKKDMFIYSSLVSVPIAIVKTCIEPPLGLAMVMLYAIILSCMFFKDNCKKIIFLVMIANLIMFVLDVFTAIFISKILRLNIPDVIANPIVKLTLTLLLYAQFWLVIYILKKRNIRIDIKYELSNKVFFHLMINLLISGIIAVPITVYFFKTQNIIATNLVVLVLLPLALFIIFNLYNTYRANKLVSTQKELEASNLYNKTVTQLLDGIRLFKHDFNNIIQAIGGYIMYDDFDGLKAYYKNLIEECEKLNNLNTLNPEMINEPSIFNIVASKYHVATGKGIKVDLEIFLDFKQLKLNPFDFSRVLGILLDNAIEAAEDTDEKYIKIEMRKQFRSKTNEVIIKNSYSNKDVDIEKIFEKEFSSKSKKTNSGLGLWEVKNIIKKYKNLSLSTSKNDQYFIQTIIVN